MFMPPCSASTPLASPKVGVNHYVALFEQNCYQRYFAVPLDTTLTVLFVAVQGDTAVQNIRIAIEQALNHAKKSEFAPLFRIAPVVADVYTLPLLPIWQRPFKPDPRVLFQR